MAGHNPLVYGDSLTNNLKDSTSSWMSISMISVVRLADERGLMKLRFAIWVSCGSKVKKGKVQSQLVLEPETCSSVVVNMMPPRKRKKRKKSTYRHICTRSCPLL